MKKFCFFLVCTIFYFSPGPIKAQTNAPSIQTGVIFQWSNSQPTSSDAATLQSIIVNGITYSDFQVPSGYALTQLGPNGHGVNFIRSNGTLTETSSTSGTWNASALAAFQDVNLNHYFESGSNGQDICDNYIAESTTIGQRQTLTYSPGFVSSANSILAVTERNANNCFHIEFFGTPAGGGPTQSLGETFVNPTTTKWGHGGTGTSSSFGVPGSINPPDAGSDYWLSDRVIENGGTIGIALFYLSNIAPVGSVITSVQLTASTADHGDGKLFLFGAFIPVPVEIISFTATPKNSHSLLNWEVGTEQHVSNYQVLHSTDGVNFMPVGMVPATGNSHYSFLHNAPVKGFNYYRLLTVDIDGKQKYSNVRLVRFDSEVTIRLFPNPTTDKVNIQLPEDWQGKQVTIDVFSQLGHLVLNKKLSRASQIESIDINKLPSGIYLIKLLSNTGQAEVRKIQVR